MTGRITRPVRSFGVKNVDFGGIRSPSRAVRSISATLTGRMSTAPTASPARTASTTRSTPCWYDTPWGRSANAVSNHRSVERAHAVERSGPRRQPLPVTVRADEAEHAVALHRRERGGRNLARVASLEVPVEGLDQLVPRGVVVEPVDRLDAQLVGDEFAHEGECLLGRTGRPAGLVAPLVAVGPADAVTVVAVGDQHVVGREERADRIDPTLVGDPFDDVLHALDGDRGDRLGRFGEQLA